MFSWVDQFCLEESLSTYDPYDVWKTQFGGFVKKNYYGMPSIFIGPAACLTILDLFLNNSLRLFYKKQEYPIVRAQAALILLNSFNKNGNDTYLKKAKEHVDWLIQHTSIGYSGLCWGLGFNWPAAKNLVYDANTPHVTHSPYALEAIALYFNKTNDKRYLYALESCLKFYEEDLVVMIDDDMKLAVSYGPFHDRIVTNASSYALLALSLLANIFPDRADALKLKIVKLYNFIVDCQRPDGSWFYCPKSENSFIDCFHSCIILKNLIKANKYFSLPGSFTVVNDGFNFIQNKFYNPHIGLYKRFATNNKPSLVKFDLYDNAEVLVILKLLNRVKDASELEKAIETHFVKKNDIYSVLDIFYYRRNKNMLRWAVMPYLYSLSI